MGHGGWMLNVANTKFPWVKLIDGVELFFVLSGFLIGKILIETFHGHRELTLQHIKHFWIRRWFRTLPNYYLILIVNVLFVYFGVIKEDISQFNWKFLFFLHNFSTPFYGFFWESWSLSIEEWFYLLFPLILWSIYMATKTCQLSKKRVFLSAILIFLLVPLLLRFFIASHFSLDAFWLETKVFKVVIYRLDGIALGLFAAFFKYWHPNAWYTCRNYTFIIGIILTYIILYTPWQANDFSTKVFKMSLQSIGCFLLLPKFDSMRSAPRIITRVVTHISLISYSMYLINLALVSEVIRDHFPPHTHKMGWIMYIIYWGIVIVVSTLLYKYYEKPMMDIRDKVQAK